MDGQLIEARRKVAEMSNRLSIVTSSVQSAAPAIETLKKTIANQEKEAAKVKVDAKTLEDKQKIVEELEKSNFPSYHHDLGNIFHFRTR